MTRLDEIREIYEYDRWANARLLEAVATLPEEAFTRDLGSSFPSVRDTLVHILEADWIWLSRWEGVSPRGTTDGWAGSTLGELRSRWAEVEENQEAFLAALDDADLDEVIAYSNTAGTPFESPLWRLLRHVINHSTYHRGQVVTMLRQLGADAPATDLVHFFRTRPAGADAIG